MKLYRFSPIKTENELLAAIEHIHFEGYKLCKQKLGAFFPNAGNIGIFCHYDEEYATLIALRKTLTAPSDNPNQKYFTLHIPITIPAHEDIPEATYTELYIRKPDPYRHHVGDIDFYVEDEAYTALKNKLLKGAQMPGVRIFERPDLDLIELFDPDSDVLPYVSTKEETKKVHVKQSDATTL
jgi:hypothetical protein